MVNEKPVTNNGFRFRTTCTHKHTAIRKRCNFGDAWICCHSETLVKTPLFGNIGHGQYSIIIRYEDNGSVRYDGKDYVESLARVQKEKSMTEALQIGENVTVKRKLRVWKAAEILFIRSTVAQPVACNTLIRPFSFANTESCSYNYRHP